MKDRIEISSSVGGRRDRFFARAAGTQFRALAPSDGRTEIDLFDEIGFWGVTAKDFREKIKAASGDIVLKINSPGGDVFDGIAIYNELIGYAGRVRVEIVGMAASAASIVAMAGDEIAMADNAFMMIHNAWVLAIGNRHDLSDAASVLAKIDGALAKTYATRTGLGVRTIGKMMDDETWMTGAEAKESGFATELLQPADKDAVSAKFDLSVYANAPQALQWSDAALVRPETEEDIEKVLMRDAGHTRSQARALIREIRAGKTSTNTAMPGAGAVELGELALALQGVTAAIPTR